MTANTPADRRLKNGLLDDTLTIVNLEKMYSFCYEDWREMRSKLVVLTLYIEITRGLKMEWEISAFWGVSTTDFSRCPRWPSKWLFGWLKKSGRRKQIRPECRKINKTKTSGTRAPIFRPQTTIWTNRIQPIHPTLLPITPRVPSTKAIQWENHRLTPMEVWWSCPRWLQLEIQVWATLRWRPSGREEEREATMRMAARRATENELQKVLWYNIITYE